MSKFDQEEELQFLQDQNKRLLLDKKALIEKLEEIEQSKQQNQEEASRKLDDLNKKLKILITEKSEFQALSADYSELNEQLKDEQLENKKKTELILELRKKLKTAEKVHVNVAPAPCLPQSNTIPKKIEADNEASAPEQHSYLLSIIDELNIVNTKLKSQQIEMNELLENSRTEIVQLRGILESNDMELPDSPILGKTIHSELQALFIPPKPEVTTGKDEIDDPLGASNSNTRQVDPLGGSNSNTRQTTANPLTATTNLSTLTAFASKIFQRIEGSDIVTLNRSLRKSFDINAVTELSNDILENLITDVENLSLINEVEGWDDHDQREIVKLVQVLLKDIINDRIKLNAFSLTYTERLENKAQLTSPTPHTPKGLRKGISKTWSFSQFLTPFNGNE